MKKEPREIPEALSILAFQNYFPSTTACAAANFA